MYQPSSTEQAEHDSLTVLPSGKANNYPSEVILEISCPAKRLYVPPSRLRHSPFFVLVLPERQQPHNTCVPITSNVADREGFVGLDYLNICRVDVDWRTFPNLVTRAPLQS